MVYMGPILFHVVFNGKAVAPVPLGVLEMQQGMLHVHPGPKDRMKT